tara:strand:+ start:3753 stop:3971 length:219 start_codon:yes stop_codon:yes gene_type:complete
MLNPNTNADITILKVIISTCSSVNILLILTRGVPFRDSRGFIGKGEITIQDGTDHNLSMFLSGLDHPLNEHT